VNSNLLYVVAFDPGETIGWSVMGVMETDLRTTEVELQRAILQRGMWQYGQIDTRHLGSNDAGVGMHRGHAALNFVGENIAVEKMMDLAIWKYPKSAVVLEKFVLDPKQASGKFDLLSPVRIISAFSYALHDFAMSWPDKNERDPYNRFYLINRGDPKRTCTNERLKHWGFDPVVSHKLRHACDATRIAYYFLRDCRGSSQKAQEARHRAWPHVFADPMANGVPARRRSPKPSLGERI
jgi:hypothetical protein